MQIDLSPLIDALDRNTAALKANGGAAAADTAATKPKPAGKGAAKAKPTHTYDEMSAALMKIKDDFGIDAAKAVYIPHGYTKMSEIKESDYDKIYDEAVDAHTKLSDEAGGGEESGDL